MKKKLCIFIGIFALLAGLRLCDNGLLGIEQEGRFTVFTHGAEAVYEIENRPVLDRFNGYTRLDTYGGTDRALQGLKDIGAKILWTENAEGIIIIYAYSPYINKYEIVHGKKVNVMTALNDGHIAYGCPLLKGSY